MQASFNIIKLSIQESKSDETSHFSEGNLG